MLFRKRAHREFTRLVMFAPKIVAGSHRYHRQPVAEVVPFERRQRSIGSQEYILHRVFYLIERHVLLHNTQNETLVFFHQVLKRIHVAGNNPAHDLIIIRAVGVIIHYDPGAAITPVTYLLYSAWYGHWQPQLKHSI